MASLLSITVAVLAVLGVCYVYVFGIPPALKRRLENKALETMGENKASYMMKDAIGNVPTTDQREVKDIKGSLSNVAGGSLQNPLGKFAGDTADDTSSPLTGR